MLNPPLSLLSDDLIDYLVGYVASLDFTNEAVNDLSLSDPADHIARLSDSYSDKTLHNLSLADRAFTESCQKHLFRTLTLGRETGTRGKISKKLTKVKRILDDRPLFATLVRKIQLFIEHGRNAWIFQNPSSGDLWLEDGAYGVSFISILHLLADSPIPPHELHIMGSYPIEDPILVVRQLAKSFFAQTLTILHLIACKNVPLPLFLLCPRLREVRLDRVGPADDKHPAEHCSGREAPALELLDYRNSHTIIKQMLSPPPGFPTPIILWSRLRVLTLCPHEREAMALLQPILDAACTTLEELYLTNPYVGPCEQLPLVGLVTLSGLPRLRVFALDAILKPRCASLSDINVVLGTIPTPNTLTNLFLDFSIFGKFGGCLAEDWVGMCDEVIRISSNKPLELDLHMATMDNGPSVPGHGEDGLYLRIMERIQTRSLSNYPEICTHFWNPTYWSRGISPFPRGAVRPRCTR